MVDEIIARAFPGSRVLRVWGLKGGIVAEMRAVLLETGAGEVRTVVVRRHETAVYEYRVLRLMAGLGVKTAEALFLDLEEGALVMDYVEGGIDFDPAERGAYIGQMAGALAAIHGVDLSGLETDFLKRLGPGCGELGRTPPDSGAAGFDVGSVTRLLEQTGLLEGFAAPVVERPCLVHGDFWGGNVLWRDGRLLAVIDWEDAGLGDRLKDLAEARVELVWLFGVGAADDFLDHYGNRAAFDVGGEDGRLAYWDLCAVLRLFRLTGGDWGWLVNFVGEYGRDDLTAEWIGGEYGRFVARAVGRLEGGG